MKKRLLIALLAPSLLLASEPVTQDWYSGSYKYELDSTDLIYCVGGKWRPGFGNIETSGSSTTTTGVNATDDPFDAVAVGDVIQANGLVRRVTAKASVDSITVDSAWNLDVDGGKSWQFIAYTCGTAATNGWLPSGHYSSATYVFEITQMNATSIDARLECVSSAPGAAPVPVYPATSGSSSNCASGTHASGYCNFTSATGAKLAVTSVGDWFQCRWGMKINTDDGDDLTTNAEQITTYVEVKK